MKKVSLEKIALTLIILVSLLGLAACSPQDGVQEKPTISVSVSSVGLGDIRTADHLNGRVKASQEVNILPLLSAEVEEVYVKTGGQVEKGQALVRLDKENIQKQRDQAAAAFLAAKSQMETAKDNYERMKRLYEEGAVAEQQYTSAKAQYEQVRDGSYQTARISLSQANDQLENATITAPIQGVVGFMAAQKGQMVSPSSPLASVLDLSKMEASFGLSEGQINQVKVGSKLAVSIPSASDQPFSGTITEASPQADPQSRLFNVTVEIDNQKEMIKSGMSATISLIKEEVTGALLVKEDAIRHTQTQDIVFILEGDTVRQESVQVLLSDGQMTAVEGDISKDDQVVVLGKERLSDGSQVRVVDEGGQS